MAANAVNFDIPVSSDLDSVHFLWFNPDPLLPVSYKLVIKLLTGSDPEVSDDDDQEGPMHQPFVNISHSGTLLYRLVGSEEWGDTKSLTRCIKAPTG